MQFYHLINHRVHINHLFFGGNHQNPQDSLLGGYSLVALCSIGSHSLGKLMIIIYTKVQALAHPWESMHNLPTCTYM